MNNTDAQKVTICFVNSDSFALGVSVVEGRLLTHGRRKYAQYDAAPFVEFVPKKARHTRRVQTGYRPYLIILEGWNLGLIQDTWVNAESFTPGVEVKRSRYSSFDPRWATDFDATLEAKGAKILADYRDRTKGDA